MTIILSYYVSVSGSSNLGNSVIKSSVINCHAFSSTSSNCNNPYSLCRSFLVL